MTVWHICFALSLILTIGIALWFLVLHPKERRASLDYVLAYTAIALIVGSFFIFMPQIVTETQQHGGGIVEGLLSALYSVIQVATFQTSSLVSQTEFVHSELTATPWFASIYSWVMQLFAILTPLFAIGAVISYVIKQFKDWHLRATLAFGARNKEVFVFSEYNENSKALANDILNAYESGQNASAQDVTQDALHVKPRIVFASMKKEEAEKAEAEMEHFTQVVFTQTEIARLPVKFRNSSNSFYNGLHYFVLSSNREKNVSVSLDLADEIAKKIAEQFPFNKQEVDSGISPECQNVVQRVHIHCLFENHENWAVCDNGSKWVAAAGDPSLPEHAHRAAIRKGMEFHLFSDVEERVRCLLANDYPLFNVLDTPTLSAQVDNSVSYDEEPRRQQEPQSLTVFVAGLGKVGLEFLKTAYWIGQMDGVRLRIVAADIYAETIMNRLKAECPAMNIVELVGAADAPHAEQQKADSAMPSGGLPIVEWCAADVYTRELEEVYRKCGISGRDRVYSLIAIGDDSGNLKVALRVQRYLSSLVKGLQDSSRIDPQVQEEALRHFPITFCIESSEVLNAVRQLQQENKKLCPLIPFGSTEKVFSYSSIVHSPWERLAVRVHIAYDKAYRVNAGVEGGGTDASAKEEVLHRIACFKEDLQAAVASYNATEEVKKASNRASALHIPYRLWALGLQLSEDQTGICKRISASSNKKISEAEWFRAIGLYAVEDLGSAGRDEAISVAGKAGNSKFFYTYCDFGSEYPTLQASVQGAIPVVWRHAAIEHNRWWAYYATEGWQDVEPEEMDALCNTAAADATLDVLEKQRTHQAVSLKRHGCMCDMDKLGERAKHYQKDFSVYDRVIVAETLSVVTGLSS